MIHRLDNKDFDKMFLLMEKSFPLDELRTYDDEKALLERPEYGIYVLPDAGGGIIGFITAWTFDEFGYIDHFAVDPSLRNGGFGGKILSETVKQIGSSVCLEVECPDNDMAVRRIGFYKRNGFCLNDYPYIQPPISKGRNPIPLLIMTNDRQVDKREFDMIKRVLYERVYKVPVKL